MTRRCSGIARRPTGRPAAQASLGVMYRNGQGIPKDDAQAVFWFQKAADQGLATAQGYLGYMYLEGGGVKHDDAAGAAWMLKAAQQGVPWAQYSIGFLYDNARGLPHDAETALEWYRKAADNGNSDAKLLLQGRKDHNNAALGVLLGLGILGLIMSF